jgi:hypothetical protein
MLLLIYALKTARELTRRHYSNWREGARFQIRIGIDIWRIRTYDLLLETIIKSQVCYEERIPFDTECLSELEHGSFLLLVSNDD